MVRMIRKSKQTFLVTEDSFGRTKGVFEFQYQDTPGVQSAWNPNTDIFETEDHIYILIEAAGLNEDSLHLHAVDNRLVLSGERKQVFDEPVIRYHQLEIQFMPFQKTIILPGLLDVDSVQAQYRDGLLTILIPKESLKR